MDRLLSGHSTLAGAAAAVKVTSISTAYLPLYHLRYWTMWSCMNCVTGRNLIIPSVFGVESSEFYPIIRISADGLRIMEQF